jgi:cobalt-zinc-cadmium efflux system protein
MSGNHTSAAYQNKKQLKIVLLLTGSYLVAEIIGGIATKSLALLADAGHMFTDVGGLILSLIAINIAQRKASAQRTYGFYRAEILAALTNAVVLIGVSIYILYEAWQRFKDPPEVSSKTMLLIACIGLVINIIGMRLLKKGSKESLNMKGAYFEVLSDMLTSIGVIIAGIIMLTTGWYYADPLISAGIGLFILPRTWILLKDAVGVLLEGTPSDVNITSLQEAVMKVQGVAGLHDLHVWSLTSGTNAMSAHIQIKEEENIKAVLTAVKQVLRDEFKIVHSTLQTEEPDFDEHPLNF